MYAVLALECFSKQVLIWCIRNAQMGGSGGRMDPLKEAKKLLDAGHIDKARQIYDEVRKMDDMKDKRHLAVAGLSMADAWFTV